MPLSAIRHCFKNLQDKSTKQYYSYYVCHSDKELTGQFRGLQALRKAIPTEGDYIKLLSYISYKSPWSFEEDVLTKPLHSPFS